MKKTPRHFSGEEKVTVIRRHLMEGIVVSNLCDQNELQPKLYYRWQNEFFEVDAAAFERNTGGVHKDTKQIAALEEKLERKNEVLSELMEEYVMLKKSLRVL